MSESNEVRILTSSHELKQENLKLRVEAGTRAARMQVMYIVLKRHVSADLLNQQIAEWFDDDGVPL